MRWVSRLVTVAIGIAIVAAVALLIRSQMPTVEIGGQFRTWAKFRDGSRLAVGSPVVIAGVRVGDVTALALEGGLARIDMQLVDDLQIPVDSFVTRRADSLFGDSYLEIIPTSPEPGAPSVRYLRSGEQLVHVIEGGSTDATLRAMARAMPKVDSALELVHEFVLGGRKWTNGRMVENLEAADRWIAAGPIERPISMTAQAMERVEDATTRGAAQVSSLVPVIPDRLAAFDRWISSARTSMAEARTGLATAMRDAREGMDGIDRSTRQLADVMAAINEGSGSDWKGSLGRMVNEPELANSLEDASEAGREGMSGFNRFKSWVGMRLEMNVFARMPRIYATAKLTTRTDKFYLVEFEKGPLGAVPADELSEVAGSGAYTRRQEIDDGLRFTAQFGKQFGRFALRGGIKESTFGAGADVLLGGRLELSADVYGSFQRTPRVKLAAAMNVFHSVYVLAGIDDALNTPGYLNIEPGNTDVPDVLKQIRFGRDYFIGAGLYFTDADFATLLRVYGAVLAGLLVL